jgi:RND family efflux transporter MFP subunit
MSIEDRNTEEQQIDTSPDALEATHPAFDEEYFEEPPAPKARRIRRRVIALAVFAVIAVGGFFVVQKANGDDDTDAAEEQTADAGDADAKDVQEENGKKAKKGKKGAKGEDGEEEEETLIPVEVAAVESGSVAAYITSTANLVPEHDVKIVSEAGGRVQRLLVDEGDRVQAGQPLVILQDDDATIALQKAGAKLANAKMAFDRAEQMKAQELISSQEHDKTAMEYRIAKQEVAEAQWGLSKRTVRAPFDGQITERFVDLGQNVKTADDLFQLASYVPLVARIFLPEREVIGLETGREVTLALAADDSIRFAGRIQKISPVVDTATGTVKVTVEATEKPDQVRPGGFVTVRVVRERRDEVLVVPRESVIRELDQAHVFVSDGATAAKREVEVGMEEGDRVEITEGLSRGDQVITAGQGGLKSGDKIKVLDKAQVAELPARDAAHRRG